MKKLTKVTAGTILVPVLSFTLAHEPGHAQADEYLPPHPDHTEERPSSAPERFVGKPSVILHTSSGILWSGPIPRSWPPLPSPNRPLFELT